MRHGRPDPAFRLGLAKSLIGLGAYQDAEAELRRTLAETGSPAARGQLAWTLWRLGRNEAAEMELRQIDIAWETVLSTGQLTDLIAAFGPQTSDVEPRPTPPSAGETVGTGDDTQGAQGL
jgi:hypothetical protein